LTIFSQQVLGASRDYLSRRTQYVGREASPINAETAQHHQVAGDRIPSVVPALAAAHGASGVGVGLHARFGFGVAATYLVNVLLDGE
jgi:hypothetical protein